MLKECDVAILGGALSGASLALLLRRERPDSREPVAERGERFSHLLECAEREGAEVRRPAKAGEIGASRAGDPAQGRRLQRGVIYDSRISKLDLDGLPFNGPVDTSAEKFMKFYHRRPARIARKRQEAGCSGRRNAGWRELGDGSGPAVRGLGSFSKSLFCWLGAELPALGLPAAPMAKFERLQPAPAI